MRVMYIEPLARKKRLNSPKKFQTKKTLKENASSKGLNTNPEYQETMYESSHKVE